MEEQKLFPDDGVADDRFGWSVAISGDVAVIGTYLDDDSGKDSGSAYTYVFDGAAWVQERKLLAPDGEDDDQFGSVVALSGKLALIGAPLDDDNGTNSGSVYAFNDVLDPDCNENGTADVCDIAFGMSPDENNDGIPDECELCEGDANADGVVDPLDAGFVLARFGCSVDTGDPKCDAADQNGDGLVDPLDSGYVLARFGECP